MSMTCSANGTSGGSVPSMRWLASVNRRATRRRKNQARKRERERERERETQKEDCYVRVIAGKFRKLP